MTEFNAMEEDIEDNEDGSSMFYHSSSAGMTPENNSSPLAYGCDDFWSWNVNAKSEDVDLYGPGRRTVMFHPKWSNGTGGVRGTRVLNRGRYYWEIAMSQRIFGTSMMIGIGTSKARVHVDGFIDMIGEDDQSWGLSHRGFIFHKGKKRVYTNPFKEDVPTTIGIYFDGISGELSFYKDGRNLGIAFTNLHTVFQPLYPIVSSTAAKTEMRLSLARRAYLSLQDRCRDVLIHYAWSDCQIYGLNIPSKLKDFIFEEYGRRVEVQR